MSEIVYATGSAYTNDGGGSWLAGAPKTDGSEILGRYTFPSIADYADAKSIKLVLYKKSGSGTLNLSWYKGIVTASLGSFSVTSSTTTATLDLSSHISTLTSRNEDFYIRLQSNGTMTFESYSTSGKQAHFEIETASGGVVYFCTGGVWKPCEAYFGTGGVWKQCEAAYGNGGVWKELGE